MRMSHRGVQTCVDYILGRWALLRLYYWVCDFIRESRLCHRALEHLRGRPSHGYENCCFQAATSVR